MHVHTVLVTLTDPATRDQCVAAMSSMRGRIDGMVSLDVVVNELAGSYSADVALTTRWRDLAAYEAYTTDPVHLDVRKVVLDLMSSATTIDYTIDDTTDDTTDDTVNDTTETPR